MIESLLHLRRLDEAALEIEKSVKDDSSSAEPWLQLGRVRVRQRDRAKAKEAYDRAEALSKPGSPELSRVNAGQVDLARLDGLSAIVRGEVSIRDNAERLDLARFCDELGLAAAGARRYADAFESDPKAADNRGPGTRARAALLAAWAASGRSQDGRPLDAAELTRWRKQSLAWLKSELAAWKPVLESGPPPVRAMAFGAIECWRTAPELSTVRDATALEALPNDERDAWRAFWDQVARIP
jgi:hypothetical protein